MMFIRLYTYLNAIFIVIAIVAFQTAYADDHDKTFEQIVTDYGFPLESYKVTTEDGYILTTFRIPHGKSQGPSDDATPVLIQHGYFDACDFAVMNGPELSIPFFLAEQGFDVWLGNGRGNKYSRNHTTLNPDKDVDFWEYSFVERAADDKANINFIIEKTGKSKISMIAHSEATASLWTGMEKDSSFYKSKLNLIIALGPISRLDNIRTLLLKSLAINKLPLNAIKAFGIHEFFKGDFWNSLWFHTTCGYIPQICRFSTYLISDGDTSVDDLGAMRNYYGHYPNGISIKSLDHTLQIYMSKRFQYYDYGKDKNMEEYGTEIPPLVNLTAIDGPPTVLMVGNTDLLSVPEDAEWLKEQLGSNVVGYETYDYGHITFFIGKDVKYLDDVVSYLRQYN